MFNTLERYGKTVLITGASSGIGLAYAQKFASIGHDLVLVSRSEKKLAELCKDLETKHSIKSKYIAIDLAKPVAASELFKKVKEMDIEVSILINNAGFATLGPVLKSSLNSQLEMLDLNCRTPLELSWLFGKEMADNGKGAIIFLASVVAFMATPNLGVYGATKAFNLLLGESMAEELKSSGVDVLSISPGSTRTNFTQRAEFNDQVNKYPARTSEQVVETTLRALGKTSSVIDGIMNKSMILSLRFFPRKLQAKMLGKIYSEFME